MYPVRKSKLVVMGSDFQRYFSFWSSSHSQFAFFLFVHLALVGVSSKVLERTINALFIVFFLACSEHPVPMFL